MDKRFIMDSLSELCDHSRKPKPFIKPCYFCQKDVEMVKDSTEGRPVACFDHSYKFTPKVVK